MSLITEPIFLVGAERSGTTLLRLMLHSHSQLSWCNEFEYSVDLINDEQNWPELDKYYQWLSTHRIFQATRFQIDDSLEYPQLVNSFLVQKKTDENKPLVGATVHRNFDRLLRIWPDSKFIHIVRDGRDVARSCIGMSWTGNVWTGVERWIKAEKLWASIEPSLPNSRKVEINYESLITQPHDTLAKLCDFMGIAFEAEMLNYYKTTSYSSPDPKLINQWRNKLSDREVQLVESRISQLLVERNYPLSNFPPLKVNIFLKSKLRLHCWFKRVQFRIEKFGLYLLIADYLSRNLRIKPWQTSIKLQINQIIQSQLK